MESIFHISGCAIENQVKFAACTMLDATLIWWNGHVKGNNFGGYTQPFQELTLMCTKFLSDETEKVDKYIHRLPDNIHGNVMSARPKTLDFAIELANDLMDQKLRTYAERQAENKRKLDNNNQDQQQLLKKQNVVQAYAVGSGEKKLYGGSKPLCPKCNYHHNGECAPNELHLASGIIKNGQVRNSKIDTEVSAAGHIVSAAGTELVLLTQNGELRESRVPVPDPDLLRYTYFDTHTVDGVFAQDEAQIHYEEMLRLGDLGANTSMGMPYTEDQIMAMVRKGKQRWHILCVGRVLAGQAGTSSLSTSLDACTPTPMSMSGSGGGGNDEPGADENADEDEASTGMRRVSRKMMERGIMSPGIVSNIVVTI
nr:hypothetical protein [Tanacetum cinerariifolium]